MDLIWIWQGASSQLGHNFSKTSEQVNISIDDNNQQNILQMAKMLLKQILIVTLTSWLVLGSTVINPANYIWINYNTQVPLQKKTDDTYTVTLPCKSRIGKCSYRYSLLPFGWSANEDGSLNVPKKDAETSGVFSVTGDFTQPTGERLNAVLVAEIQNGTLKVQDKLAFYNKLGVRPKQDFPIPQSRYAQSSLTRSAPQQFPSLAQIQKQLKTKKLQNVPILVKDILNRFAPCRSKINYLTDVALLFQEAADKNREGLRFNENQLERLRQRLAQLKYNKRRSFDRQNVTQKIQDLTNRIQKQQANLITLTMQRGNYQRLVKETNKQLQRFNNIYFQERRFPMTLSYYQLLVDNAEIFRNITDQTIIRREIEKKMFDTLFNITYRRVDPASKNIADQLKKQYSNRIEDASQAAVEMLKNKIKELELRSNLSIQQQSSKLIDQRLQQLKNQQQQYKQIQQLIQKQSLKIPPKTQKQLEQIAQNQQKSRALEAELNKIMAVQEYLSKMKNNLVIVCSSTSDNEDDIMEESS